MRKGYEDADFERAVAVVGAEPSPQALVERLGLDWEGLQTVAREAAAAVLAEDGETRAAIVACGAESFTAGFLVGAELRGGGAVDPGRLAAAVDELGVRGRHAVIADHCDLAGVARLETLYADALVASVEVAAAEREALRQPLTRIFEAGLATGLLLAPA